jgi:hypothetical protein
LKVCRFESNLDGFRDELAISGSDAPVVDEAFRNRDEVFHHAMRFPRPHLSNLMPVRSPQNCYEKITIAPAIGIDEDRVAGPSAMFLPGLGPSFLFWCAVCRGEMDMP